MVQAKNCIMTYLPSKYAKYIDDALDEKDWAKLQEIRVCALGGL